MSLRGVKEQNRLRVSVRPLNAESRVAHSETETTARTTFNLAPHEPTIEGNLLK
jgi:hypothetical protein